MDQILVQRERIKEFYVYEVDYLSLAASGSNVAGTFLVDSTANFVMQRNMVDLRSNTTGTWQDPAQTPITITWQNVTSGRSYMSAAVAVPSLYGSAQLPHIMGAMLVIPAKSTFALSTTNLSASAIYARFTHEGYKEYLHEYVA